MAKTLICSEKEARAHRPDTITKWDGFSRNAGDAYQMINILSTLGVEPQAIEQPLDISIPENKLMLAIYLAQPEVENAGGRLIPFLVCAGHAKKADGWGRQ